MPYTENSMVPFFFRGLDINICIYQLSNNPATRGPRNHLLFTIGNYSLQGQLVARFFFKLAVVLLCRNLGKRNDAISVYTRTIKKS